MRWFLLLSLAATLASAKIFDKCELADVLETKHSMTRDQVKNWVCIAQYESTFNVSAINHFNWDGSKDYGLFQLNNKYWCKDADENPSFQNVCRMPCSKLLDADLTDDLVCIKKIIRDTEAWKGKGTALTAWVAYVKKCQYRNLDEYMSECWAGDNVIGIRDDDDQEEQESNAINVESNAINVRDQTPEDNQQGIVNNARVPIIGHPLFHGFPFLPAQQTILKAQQRPFVASPVHHIIPHYQPHQVPMVITNPFGFLHRRL